MASKFEEGKTIDGNVRPVNLLSKLYQKCVQLEIKKKEDEPKSNSLNNISEVEQRDPDTISDIKELSSTIKNICSPVESVNMNNKLKLLSSLSTALKANPLLYEAIESSPLLYFSEKLLKNYSKTICRYWDQMHTTHCDTSELTLLIPILEILSLSVDTSVQEIRSVLLYNSEVILYLMQTVTQCCYNVSITHMKLNDALFEKKLAGALYDMHCLEVQALYTNWLGFHVPINRLKGYYMTLFEVSDVREMNINQYIIKKQPPSGSEYTEIETENPKIDLVKDCYEDVATAEWSPITVARMILLKTALVYTREDWKDCLFRFSSQLKDVLQQVNEDGVHQCLVGSMCGFRSIINGEWGHWEAEPKYYEKRCKTRENNSGRHTRKNTNKDKLHIATFNVSTLRTTEWENELEHALERLEYRTARYAHKDGLFEGESLTKVPYQRGQILALTGDWAMVWAVDVGVLGFVPKVKMCVLPQDMENEPWLISVCLLRVQKYSYKIECKKTDSTTWKEKEEAWEKLSLEFNSCSGGAFRSAKNLNTGGSKPSATNITPIDTAIKDLMGETSSGLEALCDSNDLVSTERWKMWNPVMLKEPVSAALWAEELIVEIEDGVTAGMSSGSERRNIKRKRNDLTTDCRMKCTKLSEARYELMQLQKDSVKKEMLWKKEEHKMKMQCMEKEAEMKQEMYKWQIELLKKQLDH
ncbi:hypothetical protein C0J52_21848 [Blattella germanica]|nr:hypothetical protein C0J52_21848 [Blattella germanica]